MLEILEKNPQFKFFKEKMSFVVADGKISVGIDTGRGSGDMKEYDPLFEKIQKELKVEQGADFIFKIATSPKELLESTEPMLLHILKGFSVDIKIHAWKKISDVIMSLVTSGELDQEIMPFLGGISPLFLLKINGNLNIEIDDHMKSKIMENPLVEPILLDANSLIMSASQVHSDDDDDWKEHLGEHFSEEQQEMINFIVANMGDEIDLSINNSRVGIKARLTADGLAAAYKTAIKFKQ
jgi:hypothetical protein